MRAITVILLLAWGGLSQAQDSTKFTFALPDPFFQSTPDTLTFSNGKRYIGQRQGNTLEGRGMLLAPGGDTLYIGQFTENKKHGLGRYYFSAGNIYSGEWRDNHMHGRGEMKFYTGDRYVGSWFDDRRHGQGAYYFAEGGSYEGQFFEDKRHGQGTLTTETVIYEGNWINNQQEGMGKETRVFPEHKEVYEGSFRQGIHEGKGVWRFIKGGIVTTEYEGNFTAGQRQREGIYRIGDRTLTGTWMPDAATGTGKSVSSMGEYDGKFLQGFFNGQGTMHYANGDRYEGEWVRGKRQGQGKMVWADGQVYEGEWMIDQPHGQGIMYLDNGKIREGEFAQGEFVRRN
jgi:hypothetical protein